MARRKGLGPANDSGVPADELILAKLVQNAKAHGLGAGRRNFYSRRGRGCTVDDATHCCALGAELLTQDRIGAAGLPYVVQGNDGIDSATPDYGLVGWTVGAAFQDAMR